MHYIEPPVAVQRADMDFPGAESDLEAERDIKTKKNKPKHPRWAPNSICPDLGQILGGNF